jgi:hypothetical protein
MLGAMDAPRKPLTRTQLTISAVGLLFMGWVLAVQPDGIRWVGYAVLVWSLFPIWRLIKTIRKPVLKNPRGEKCYVVRAGEMEFRDLTASEALAKVHELVAKGVDPFLYDEYGDPMGLRELEEIVGGHARRATPT